MKSLTKHVGNLHCITILSLLGAAWMAGLVQADIIKPAGPIPIVAGTTSGWAYDPAGLLSATEFGSPYTGADAVPYATVPLMSFGANPNFGQADVWYGPSGDVNAKDWIAVDLGQTYDLTDMYLWEGYQDGWRPLTFSLYKLDSMPTTGADAPAGTLIKTWTGAQWTGGSWGGPHPGKDYVFDNTVNAQYLMLKMVTAENGGSFTELRFVGTPASPPPTTTTTTADTTTTTAGGATTTTTVTATTTTTTSLNPTILPSVVTAQGWQWSGGIPGATVDGIGMVPAWDTPAGPGDYYWPPYQHQLSAGSSFMSPSLVTANAVVAQNHAGGTPGWMVAVDGSYNVSGAVISGPTWIAFNLGGDYDLTGIDFWPYTAEADRCVKDMSVSKLSALPSNGDSLSTALALVVPGSTVSYTSLVQNNGSYDTPNNPLAYTATGAHYVLFHVTASWGTYAVGINEVRFEGVPAATPTTTTTAAPTTTTTTVAATTTTTTTALLATSIGMQAGKPVVGWNGATSWFYTVEFTPSLFPLTPWSNVTDYVLVPGVNGPMSALDTNVLRQGFYRIRMTQ